jgi:RecA/RadA recombinase
MSCLHVQIYGPESSGKTTLAMHAIAEVQKLGGNACLIDAENAFDVVYAEVSSSHGSCMCIRHARTCCSSAETPLASLAVTHSCAAFACGLVVASKPMCVEPCVSLFSHAQ